MLNSYYLQGYPRGSALLAVTAVCFVIGLVAGVILMVVFLPSSKRENYLSKRNILFLQDFLNFKVRAGEYPLVDPLVGVAHNCSRLVPPGLKGIVYVPAPKRGGADKFAVNCKTPGYAGHHLGIHILIITQVLFFRYYPISS